MANHKTLEDEFKESKENEKFIVKNSYFPNSISWERILELIYKEACDQDSHEQNEKSFKQIREHGPVITVHGNILIQDPLWIKTLTGKLWNHIPEIKTFLSNLNKDFNGIDYSEDCSYYSGTSIRRCECQSTWHIDGMVISLATRLVSEHKDFFDAAYVQLIGKSYWRIKGAEETVLVLEPGDLLLLPNELTHEVWGDGPRVGILLENTKSIIR